MPIQRICFDFKKCLPGELLPEWWPNCIRWNSFSFFFFCRSSHYYAIPSGDEPISPQLVAFLRIFQMCEGLFLVVGTRSVETTVVRGQNMQISHSLRYRRIDRSTADWLISIFRNNAGTPLSTLQSNSATLKHNWTFLVSSFDPVSTCVTESKLFERLEVWLWV